MIAGLLGCVALAGCANNPPPDWQMNAHGSMERAVDAYLSGQSRIEVVEFARARAEVARTGRVDLLARAELVRCATRVASLVFEPCQGYAALATDAPAAERAYANYLAGQLHADDLALLPAQHRAIAGPGAGTGGLAELVDPLSRLVAAGVLLRNGAADPRVIEVAIGTASAQGWRRPLLAWLGVQAQRAQAAGDRDEAMRIRRRIDLIGEAR